MEVACGEHIIEEDRTGVIDEACDMQPVGGGCSRARCCYCGRRCASETLKLKKHGSNALLSGLQDGHRHGSGPQDAMVRIGE